jgi:cyclophilin family peptidyl-prolyl cis-trans isomerase
MMQSISSIAAVSVTAALVGAEGAKPTTPFKTLLTVTEMTNKQAVVNTTAGTLQPEFNDTQHVKGIVSMARGGEPASATTSFFIATGDASLLDGKYTAFGRVVEGLSAVEAIEQTPVNGETPVTRLELKTVRIVKGDQGP